MKTRGIFLLALAGAIVLFNSVFVLDEREYAVRFRFGEIVQTYDEAGLHFKLPFVNNIEKFPEQILTINNPREAFLTAEKKNLLVDFFVKWKIVDVAGYYTTLGDELRAQQRLLEIIKDDIRAEFAKRTVPEVVSAERRELMFEMLSNARRAASEFGIDVVDVRVKRIEFRDEVSESVFQRMRQERARVASALRAEGAETAEQIRADADRQRVVILADAYRDAEIMRGEGDAIAAEIYANAYTKDPEFYSFSRSINAYRNSFGEDDILVLDSESDFFRYLNDSENKK
jgi:membrane protease subunit HflC